MILQTPCAPEVECPCRADFPPLHRLFVAVRGNTSLTYLDVTNDTPPQFECLGKAEMPMPGTFAACDDAHRIVEAKPALGASLNAPPDVPLPNEPYALAIDPIRDCSISAT